MHACSLMLVIASVFIFTSSAIDFIGYDVVKSIVVNPKEEQTTPNSNEGLRRKRYIDSTDGTNIVNKINSLRGSVGASDMNYLTYSSSLAFDVFNWTIYCDFDTDYYTTTANSIMIKVADPDPPDHVSVLEETFTDPKFYKLFRSVHLRSVGAAEFQCFGARVKGKYYFSTVYLWGYAFSYTSGFNENLTQYTLGEECTTCLSRSYWCDKKLCRDDCSGQISTCTCYTSCPKCQDWNRRDCTCPSQPYSNAVALNCSKRETGEGVKPVSLRSGGTPYKAASWAMIVVSTLAFFHLQ